MSTNYEVVQQTIERLEGGPPYDPQWIAVEAPAGKYVVNFYGDFGGDEILFNRVFGTDPRLIIDGSNRVIAVVFRQNIYDPPNGNEGQNYDVFVVCVADDEVP